MQVLVVSPPERPLPTGTVDLVTESGWDLAQAGDFEQALDRARSGDVDAVIMPQPLAPYDDAQVHTAFDTFLRYIAAKRIAAFLVGDRKGAPNGFDKRALVEVVDPDIPLAELRGRLSMVDRYHGLVRRMESELRTMERLSKKLSEHFTEVDQEMQLAGRLQRNFLPNLNAPIHNIDFASIFRPASFVSGDIYDVVRVDDRHTAVYLADAVGHGMAASLLTMFIKRSIVPRRGTDESYTIVEPAEVLATLNDALADEQLTNCQFVTGCYMLIDHRSGTLRFARGGHPYPLLISPDGTLTPLKSSGGLLGIIKGDDFEMCEVKLQPGDKVLLHTDGVELAFGENSDGTPDVNAFERLVQRLATLSVRDMLHEINVVLDAQPESVAPADDLTILAFEARST